MWPEHTETWVLLTLKKHRIHQSYRCMEPNYQHNTPAVCLSQCVAVRVFFAALHPEWDPSFPTQTPPFDCDREHKSWPPMVVNGAQPGPWLPHECCHQRVTSWTITRSQMWQISPQVLHAYQVAPDNLARGATWTGILLRGEREQASHVTTVGDVCHGHQWWLTWLSSHTAA